MTASVTKILLIEVQIELGMQLIIVNCKACL